MNERSLALIFGYLPSIDEESRVAKKLGLHERFSIALDTYRSEYDSTIGMYFDYELLINIFSNLFTLISYDSIVISTDGKGFKVLRSFEDTANEIRIEAEKPDNDSFHYIKLYSGGNVVCYIETEFYTAVGGTIPYHDTINYAIYLTSYTRTEIEHNIIETCKQNNFHVRDILDGSEKNLPIKTH